MNNNHIMKKSIIAMLAAVSMTSAAAHETTMFYNSPAKEWMEAMPIGNGRLSGMVYGGVAHDRLAMNEISMWSGQHDPSSNDLCGPENLAEMRKAFFEGDPAKGDSLGQIHLNGRMTSFGTHLPVGDLIIDMPNAEGKVSAYTRRLELDKAVASVSFTKGGVSYKKEYIASWPDGIMAIRISASEPGAVDLGLGLDLLRQAQVSTTDSTLSFEGKVDFPLHGPGGVNFYGNILMKHKGGSVDKSTSRLSLHGADEAVLLIDIRTDYNDPAYIASCKDNLGKASAKGWDNIKKSHTDDYSGLFSRMSIDLGESENSSLPTDTRLYLAKSGVTDPGLDALFFQYGRYMLIASSRPNGTPLCANLQGIWNDNGACNMPWTCDYHLDINIAQNYWSANRANLAECNEPLFSYIGLLADHGRDTARKMYGSDGWVAHTVANAWGYTAPGWGVSWGMNVTGGAWLATHLWSHYLYTGDVEWLRETGYPLLKSCAEFFRTYMTEDPSGRYLLTGPSISPENGYRISDGRSLSLSMMPAVDRQIVYDIYSACISSSKILGIDGKFRRSLEKDIKRLPPIEIGSDGLIKEWYDDVRRADPSHRHSSHLLALFPFSQISSEKTPALAEAARRSLESQTSDPNWEDTEWSTANMLCMFARLRDGETAHGWLQNLFKRFTRENLMTVSPAGVAMAEYDIFSFDATEASVAGICEMLLQSHEGYLDFLPALPEAWKSGSVKGLRAEGAIEVDMEWNDGKMAKAAIRPDRDCRVRIRGMEKPLDLKKGETRIVNF